MYVAWSDPEPDTRSDSDVMFCIRAHDDGGTGLDMTTRHETLRTEHLNRFDGHREALAGVGLGPGLGDEVPSFRAYADGDRRGRQCALLLRGELSPKSSKLGSARAYFTAKQVHRW